MKRKSAHYVSKNHSGNNTLHDIAATSLTLFRKAFNLHKQTPKARTCLRCDRTFDSSSPQHRICNRCKALQYRAEQGD